MRVVHKTLGTATMQPIITNFHPKYEELGVCFIKLDKKPEQYGTDVVLVDVEALSPEGEV